MKTREEYLLSKIPKGLDYEEKYGNNFTKYARYIGNGVYSYRDIQSPCTRLLFLESVLRSENIKYKQL